MMQGTSSLRISIRCLIELHNMRNINVSPERLGPFGDRLKERQGAEKEQKNKQMIRS